MGMPTKEDLRDLERAHFEVDVGELKRKVEAARNHAASLYTEHRSCSLLEEVWRSLNDTATDLKTVLEGDYKPEPYIPIRDPRDGGSI